jgi:adenylate kinase
LVTGTPGVGKTTISQILAVKLKALHIDIASVVTGEKITRGYDEKRQTLIADTNKLAKRVQQIISRSSKTVVVDGHYATDVVPRSQITNVFVLRCHPKELGKRMEEKGFQGSKMKENLAAEILDVCLIDAVANVGEKKVCEVDTTGQTVEATVKRVLSIIKGGNPCYVGIVDWLGRLEAEGTLEQYLQGF